MFILITLLQKYTLHIAEQYKAVNIDSIVFKNLPRAYLSHTCSVPSPCFLRIKVPLSGECTEQVWFWYVADRCKSLIYLEGQEAFKGISPRSIFLP